MTTATQQTEHLRRDRDALHQVLINAGFVHVHNGAYRCGFHDDARESAGVYERDGIWRVKCHGCGFGGDVFDVRAKAEGRDVADVLRETNATTNGQHNGQGKSKPQRKIVADYDYVDSFGALLYQVVRYHPKDFRQRQPDGNSGWIWNMKGVDRVLYRLPEINQSDAERFIFIVEGEKSADYLNKRDLCATTTVGGAEKAHLTDLSPLRDRHVVVIPDADAKGRNHAQQVAQLLHEKAASVRVLDLPDRSEHQGADDWLAAGNEAEDLVLMAERADLWEPEQTGDAPADDVENTNGRKPIRIANDEYRVVAEVIDELTKDDNLYQRGGTLVRTIQSVEEANTKHLNHPDGTWIIQPLPLANLRERTTKHCCFTAIRQTKKGPVEQELHPPKWLCEQIYFRGEWPGIRYLDAISDCPVMRPDGSIHQSPGYDETTNVLYLPSGKFPAIPQHVSDQDVQHAVDVLNDAIVDFPFESNEHKAGWFAGLFTLFARNSYEGPTPLFLFDSNIRGAGKGKACNSISRIYSGRTMSNKTYVHRGEEFRKVVTTAASEGARAVLLDNIEGPFGNATLNAALTMDRWSDRLLGVNKSFDGPLRIVWFGTANNCELKGDIVRRVIHIRLNSPHEHPEERTGFQHPKHEQWIMENRPKLAAAALTILSAYLKRGTPTTLIPFGSFEEWSDVVRQAVVWAGRIANDPAWTDPCKSRMELARSCDPVVTTLHNLIEAWLLVFGHQPVTSADVINQLYKPQHDENGKQLEPTNAETYLKSAIEEMLDKPTAQKLGYRLRQYRQRPVETGSDGDSRKHRLNTLPRNESGTQWCIEVWNKEQEQWKRE